MQDGVLTLSSAAATTFVGSDGSLEVDVPAGAVSAADVAAAGGAIRLRISQIAPGSGSNAGGSGLISFGTYLLQAVDAQGVLLYHGLRKPLRIIYHYGSHASALDLTHTLVMLNGSLPTSVSATDLAPIGTQAISAPQTGGRVAPNGGASVPVYATSVAPTSIGMGAPQTRSTTLDVQHHQLVTTAALATPSGSLSWNTDAPVATFGKPDPFNTDLSAGGLTASLPIDVPAGPGGLTPPVTLSYSSADVSEQHNIQGATGWVGEGWNLSLGAITWAEHDVTSDCVSTCGQTWEDSWQLSDPYGTAAELIPPNINVSTYYDDSPNNYCGADSNANNATSYPCPIEWHTAPETRARVFTYIGSFSLPDGAPHVSCFRVFLPNGLMEEFGCTPDSLEYYYTPGMGDYIDAWNLDLITDRQGNQIHITYDQDVESKDFKQGTTDYGTHTYIRDAVLATIQWDSPGCLNAQSACTGSAWNPQMQVVFFPSHTPTHNPNYVGSPCNTGANLRCDDPLDLSSSGGLAAPQVQSDFVLNDIEMQTRVSPSAGWNVVDGFQFSYDYGGPTNTGADPATNQQVSAAGVLLLSSVQEFGTNFGVSGTTALPPENFAYTAENEYYVDSAYHPYLNTSNCGPSWNTGTGSGCLLWAQSSWGNDEYLTSFNNGQGLETTFTWADARNNTHGVNGGGSNASNPFYCTSAGVNESMYPCNEADDQNWSRTVLTSEQSVVVQALSTGNSNITSTTNYAFGLTYPLNAQECGDCIAGMYWGNQNDGDYLDYYNGKFMGFAEVDVTHPDLSVDKHHFYATNGYGVYDTGQVHCYSSFTCHTSPWWNPANALHGHEFEVDHYDTNGTSLLSTSTSQYQVTCPPAGVSGTPASSTWGNWNGNLVSELGHNNPVAACEIHTSQTQDDTYLDAGSGPQVTTAYSYTADPTTGLLASTTATTTVNGGADGSPTTVENTSWNVWHDGVTATSTGVTGVYLANLPTYAITSGTNGVPTSCQQTLYPGSSGSGAQTSMTSAQVIAQVSYSTTCGYAGNNWNLVGPIKTTTTYDALGNAIGTSDPDANAAISGHTGCVVSGTSYSNCTGIDSTYDALPTTTTNALGQTTTNSYAQDASGGFGLWPTTVTDPNGQTTAYSYDPLGRMTSQTLPGETSGDTTTSWSYTDWCATNSADTPCVEVDQTQRLDSSHTITTRAFYDGWGHLVETRTPAPGGQDVIVYAQYDTSGRRILQSNPYFVAAYSGAPGQSAFATPDATQPGTQTTYQGLTTTFVIDALGHQTQTHSTTESGWFGDNGEYVATLTYDAEGHKSDSISDGLGRVAYAGVATGTSPATYSDYALTSYGYDYDGNLVTVTRPDGKQITSSYDLAGRQTGMNDPDRGTESYAYDPNGNVTQTADARGAGGTIYAGYDGLDRQVWRNTSSSPTNAYVTYSYDFTANGNDGVGQLTGETFSNVNVGGVLSGAYAYNYDARGQVTATSETVGATPYTTSATYNDAGQLLNQVYPDGDLLSHSYDSASGWETQLSLQQSGASGAVALLGGESYSGLAGAMGLLTGASLGGFANGVGAYTASYDPLGRLTSAATSYTPTGGSAATLYSVAPTYDALGNVLETTTTLPQGVDTQVFCYDDLSRLTWAGSSGAPACSGAPTPGDTGSLAGTSASYSASYAYDKLNRLTSGPLGDYTYGDASHADAATAIGSAWSASYDVAGEMTCRAASSVQTCSGSSPTGAAMDYDNEGQLASWQNTPTSPTQSASYLYDGAGQRVQQVATASGATTTTTSYIGNLEEVTQSGSTTTTTASYGSLAESVNGTLFYLLSDGLGSVSEAVSTAGTVTATQLYGPYGAVRYQSGTLPTDHGYTGQRSDAATSGLDYYRARYYDPVAGQFTSADTWLSGGLNRYAYVGDSPEVFVDPSGHELREGENGDGGGIDGGETDGTLGGGSGGGPNTDGSNDIGSVTDPVTSTVSMGNGETEVTYVADNDSFIENADGQDVGVVDDAGNPVTNAQIEAQAEADSQDRLSQGEQPHGEGSQNDGGSTSNDPSLSKSSNSSTDKGNARVSYVASNMQSLAPDVDTNGLTITDQTVDKPSKYSTGSYLPDITTEDSWWEVGGPGKLRQIEASKTQITRLAQGAKEYGVTPYYAWDATDMALPSDLQKLLTKWQVNVIQFIMP